MAKNRCQWELAKGCEQYVLAKWAKMSFEPDTALEPVGDFLRFSPAASCGYAFDYHFGGLGFRDIVSLILCVDRKLAEGELEEIQPYKPSREEPCSQWPTDMVRPDDPEAVNGCGFGGECNL
jgi:hypothetical protein